MTDLVTSLAAPEVQVLVVDDELHVRSALARSLTLLGYRADPAASGEQALEMLEHVSYEVMVLDILMPGMDGVEVMRRARQVCPDLLVIILTGHATLESAIAAVKSGAVDYLIKPASVHDIVAVAANALTRRAEVRVPSQFQHRQTRPRLHWTEAIAQSSPLTSPEEVLRAGPVVLYWEKQMVSVQGDDDEDNRRAKLTPFQAQLLAYFIRHPQTPLSCRRLAQEALDYDDVGTGDATGIIRPHICRLRKKIEANPSEPRLIRTVPSKSYIFCP